MGSRLLEFRPPRIAQFLVAVAALLHLGIPFRLDLFTSVVVGTLVIVMGFCMMIAGWWLFRKHRTVVCPTGTPSRLVVHGIYRITRNPMYLGIFSMLLGLAICIGGIPFYAAAIAFILVMELVFCPYEEEKLLNLFGYEFVRYKASVRRWL